MNFFILEEVNFEDYTLIELKYVDYNLSLKTKIIELIKIIVDELDGCSSPC